MNREQMIASLIAAMPELQRDFGVRSLSLFGSVARGEDRPGSDVDVLVEFDPSRTVTLFTLARLQERLEETLMRPVDLVENHSFLRAAFRSAVEKDLVRVA